jgi:hypothetical protein
MPNEYLKEMIEKNGEENSYNILETHLISREAVQILLRDPFTAEDFHEFINERKRTILDAIENICIKELAEIPPVLRELDDKIESVELNLRELIAIVYKTTDMKQREFLPSHLVSKVDHRLKQELKSNPHLKEDDFEYLEDQIQFLDFPDYFSIISNKQNWPHFEEYFVNKAELQNRIDKLSNLRNRIRHSRDVNETDKLDGQASITWFEKIMNGV